MLASVNSLPGMRLGYRSRWCCSESLKLVLIHRSYGGFRLRCFLCLQLGKIPLAKELVALCVWERLRWCYTFRLKSGCVDACCGNLGSFAASSHPWKFEASLKASQPVPVPWLHGVAGFVAARLSICCCCPCLACHRVSMLRFIPMEFGVCPCLQLFLHAFQSILWQACFASHHYQFGLWDHQFLKPLPGW